MLMTCSDVRRCSLVTVWLACIALAGGCSSSRGSKCAVLPEPPPPLGYASDPIWQLQERNGEASDFVLYDHEFVEETMRLTPAGEDHIKQIALRLRTGAPFPVIVERTELSRREGDEYSYPVHRNSELDMVRREVVVQALLAMGITDADERVMVAPEITEGFESFEAERAYVRGFSVPSDFFGFFGSFGRGFFGFGRAGF